MSVPKLRFKADDGSDFPDWKEKRLGNIFEERAERSLGGEELLSVTIAQGVIRQSDSDKRNNSSENKSNYKVVKKNDLAYNTMRMWQGAEGVSDYNGIVSPAYTIVTPKAGNNVKYFESFFKKTSMLHLFQRYSQGLTSDTWNLKFPAFAKIKCDVPCEKEQQKIVDFLSAIDTVIEKQQVTVEAWEQRKKGVMQKLFNQEVRFKADDGSDFPDWEEGTVGTLFSSVVNKNKDGSVRNVITNSAEYGLIPQRDYFDKDIAIKDNTMNYTIIQKGDFVYNPRKSTTAPFGPFNIYEREEAGIVSPLYMCLKPNNKEMAPYLTWYFRTNKWHPYIVTHGAQSGARHDRVGMTTALMAGIPVAYPSFPEQQKIVDCLSALDDVIKKQKKNLEKWQEQQMFV